MTECGAAGAVGGGAAEEVVTTTGLIVPTITTFDDGVLVNGVGCDKLFGFSGRMSNWE